MRAIKLLLLFLLWQARQTNLLAGSMRLPAHQTQKNMTLLFLQVSRSHQVYWHFACKVLGFRRVHGKAGKSRLKPMMHTAKRVLPILKLMRLKNQLRAVQLLLLPVFRGYLLMGASQHLGVGALTLALLQSLLHLTPTFAIYTRM